MASFDRDYSRRGISSTAEVSSFATRVYGWMTLGLLLTAVVALLVVSSGAYMTLISFWWVPGLVTFGIAMAMNFMIQRLSFPAMAGLFLTYGAVQGVFFGTVLPFFAAQFGGQLIWTAFATAAFIYALAMGYGIFTKSDLTSLRKILSIALLGLVGITLLYFVLSFFTTVTWMNLLISYLGLVIFVGLTAYDAQQIRAMSTQIQGNSLMSYKLSLIMALKMYINVVMIFWYLLQIFSSNRR